MSELRPLGDDVWVCDRPFHVLGMNVGTRMTVVRLAEGMELHRSRVMGVNRIELSGFTEAAKDRLKADGFFSEIISWKLRLFCPTDASGVEILDRLLARCSVTGLHARGGC